MDSQQKKFAESIPSFSQCQAFTLLQEKAQHPPSLRDSSFLSPERIQSVVSQAAGITLSWGFQKIDAKIMKDLQSLAEERQVIEQMKGLFRGDTINMSEGRAVLHPALRDLFDKEPLTPASIRKEVRQEIDKLAAFFEREKQYTDLIFIGIGGSQLGPHALIEALKPYYIPGRKFHFASNVDPDEMTGIFKTIDLKKTLVAVVSKSGTTLETETNEARARAFFAEQGVHSRDHFVSITQPKTPMDDVKRYKEVFYLFPSIGGRYSSTSMVGGVLIGFMTGVKVFLELLEGASCMDRSVFTYDLSSNPALVLALIGVWNRNFLGLPTVAIIPYSQGLNRFVAHLQQCDMESNGKSVDRMGERVTWKTGPIIWGEPGTNAQHSFFQLLHQGTDVVPVDFIGFKRSQYKEDFVYQGTTSHEKLMANFLAQAIALAQGKDDSNPNKQFLGERPSTLLVLEKVTPKSLGALLSLYENKIAFQGFLWGINSFDQEGVQLGKVLSNALLEGIKKKKESLPTTLSPLQNSLLDMVMSYGA